MSRKRRNRWHPPVGMTVIHRLQSPTTCRICKRPLGLDDTVLGWKRKGTIRAFACVDTEDCAEMAKLGPYPESQRRLEQWASDLDRIRAFA